MLTLYVYMLQQGKTAEAEAEFERLLGVSHVKIAMEELSKLDRGDDTDIVKVSELLYGRHFRGRYDPSCWYLWDLLLYISFSLFDFHIRFVASVSLFLLLLFALLFMHSFCSYFYWINPVCFTTAIWYKCCVLFLFYRF